MCRAVDVGSHAGGWSPKCPSQVFHMAFAQVCTAFRGWAFIFPEHIKLPTPPKKKKCCSFQKLMSLDLSAYLPSVPSESREL